jgi:hypothetical protein
VTVPKLAFSVPKYRRYKAKNLAVVSFGRGRDIYLGPWKSRRSRELYDQLIALWLQHGRSLPDEVLAEFGRDDPAVDVHCDLSRPTPPLASSPALPRETPAPQPLPEDGPSSITLAELADRYNAHAKIYYRKRGQSTREAEQIAEALKVAVELYGQEPASEFGPLKYQHVRDRMIAKDWSRGHINKQCSRIKRAFRWAVTQELVPAAVAGALREVEDLKKGRTLAREASQVKPVDRAVVAKTLKHVNPVVAAMIRLQYETAMRPGEIRELRPCDVDRSDPNAGSTDRTATRWSTRTGTA